MAKRKAAKIFVMGSKSSKALLRCVISKYKLDDLRVIAGSLDLSVDFIKKILRGKGSLSMVHLHALSGVLQIPSTILLGEALGSDESGARKKNEGVRLMDGLIREMHPEYFTKKGKRRKTVIIKKKQPLK